MVRRGSIDDYHREPTLRRYFTRSVSRSCANQSSLAAQSGDHVPLVEVVPRAQVLTPESEVQDPMLSFHEDNDQLVSRLFDSITQFWSLIIRDEALPLSQSQDEERENRPPVSPPTTVTDDITRREEYNDSPEVGLECDDVDEPPSDTAVSDEEELGTRDCTPGPDDGTNPTTFNLENLLLGEELKRLRVWKTTFSNGELDRLPLVRHEVAQGVLKCLTGVASTLIKRYSERQALLKSGDLIELMQNLIEQIEARILVASVEDDAMTDCDDFSWIQGSVCTVEDETPLQALRVDIDRLQRLSQSLRLGLSKGIIFAANG